MNPERLALAGAYREALEKYLAEAGEEALMGAYELGRRSLKLGMGVIESAALHQEALLAVLLRRLAADESARLAERAAGFFTEMLCPYEMDRRGFTEANALLRHLNQELERKVRERTSELENMLAELRASRARLSERERLESLKDEFLSVVSHELRTPITAVRGAIDLLRGGVLGRLPPEADELMALADRNVRRLSALVEDILDLSRLRESGLSLDIREVPLRPVVERAIAAVRLTARERHLELHADLGRTRVRADEARLEQVLLNLLNNAVKFSPAGGTVTVEESSAAGMVRVKVTDRGRGIPRAMQRAVFERFVQVEASDAREKNGSGLGLAICKAIVERHGGTIGVESDPGRGSTFWFTLQTAPSPSPAAGATPQP